jgi:hypothetical protein
MWLFWTGCCVVAGIFTALLIAYFAQSPPAHKGTWIWDTPSIMSDREEIIAFLKQNDVTNLYLYVDRQNVPAKEYARFIKAASHQGIRVEALGGDPSWGLKSNRPYIQEFIEWVESYNTNVEEDERFSGIHLDIEPYLLPEWKSDQDHTLEEWLSNMEYIAREVQSPEPLEVSFDLPFWANKIEIPGYQDYYLSKWILKRFNTLVLMDYRDTALGDDGIVANALEAVKEASSLGKSVIVGVDISKSREGNKTTFHEEGSRKMEEELAITKDQLEKYDGFRGIAVHGFPAWMSAYQKENAVPKGS